MNDTVGVAHVQRVKNNYWFLEIHDRIQDGLNTDAHKQKMGI